MGNVSIKEVAKLAGVSPTTVSRVINNSDHPVSKETSKKVEAAIKKLNFVPNRMAQGLLNNKSKIIGVIVHDISDDYFSEIVKGIESVIYKEDYIVTIYNTYRDVERELRAINMLKVYQADAVIFTGGTLLDKEYYKKARAIIDEISSNSCIVVGVTEHPFTKVNFEIGNLAAARKVTQYLFRQGHYKIGYINGPEIINTSYQRYQGVLQAFKDNKCQFNFNLLYSGDFTFEGGRKAALELIKDLNKMTAVVAANDETALGLIWELNNQGFSIPDDLSVVGIGDIPSARFSYPPLTTLSLPIYETGAAVGKYLLKTLQSVELSQEFKVELKIVERDSVKKIN